MVDDHPLNGFAVVAPTCSAQVRAPGLSGRLKLPASQAKVGVREGHCGSAKEKDWKRINTLNRSQENLEVVQRLFYCKPTGPWCWNLVAQMNCTGPSGWDPHLLTDPKTVELHPGRSPLWVNLLQKSWKKIYIYIYIYIILYKYILPRKGRICPTSFQQASLQSTRWPGHEEDLWTLVQKGVERDSILPQSS